jgi:hypothetical protein
MVKLKLLELNRISVYCNKLKYFVITMLLKWQLPFVLVYCTYIALILHFINYSQLGYIFIKKN